jgi:vitamin B12 transporter
MRKSIFLTLSAAAALLPISAHAEEDEIVVTATRTATPASRLPARVEVIDRAEIEARGLSTLAQVLGAQAVQAGGAGQQASLFLRGANSKHTLVLFDGIRINDASTPNAQYDFGQDMLGALERIEVLRGPASAVYGSDAIGGVVNLIPRRGGKQTMIAEAAVGSFDTIRGAIIASGDLGGVEYGFSAEGFETGGYDLIPPRMATHTGYPDGARLAALAGSARYAAGGFGADLVLQIRSSEAAFDTFSGGASFDLRADDPDLENQAEQSIWRLGADYAAGERLSIRASGGQVRSDRAERDDGAETTDAQATRSFVDLVASYTNTRATLTAGASLERNHIDTRPLFAAPLNVGEDQAAFYFIGQSELGAVLSLTGAVRLDDYERFGAQTTYSAGVTAHLNPLRLYASTGTAFKAPSLSERYELSAFNLGNPDLNPERARSWEVGADWTPSRALNFGISFYRTRIEDLIEYDFLQSRNINVGAAEIEGGEALLELSPTGWLSVRLAYDRTDARNAATGAQLLRRPQRGWRAELEFTPNTQLMLGLSLQHIGGRRDVTYANSGAFSDAAGHTPAHALASLWLRYNIGDLELFARLENASNERYEQPAAFAGAPRNLQIGMRARF